MSKIKAEILINLGCDIGEGPLWDEKNQKLYFVDLLKNNIHIMDYGTVKVKTITLDQNVGCISLREHGGLVAGLQHGFYFINEKSGEIELINDPENDKPNNRFNDGKCDCRGRFWAGTMSKDLDSGYGDNTPQGALYCLDTNGKVTRKLEKAAISNGLAWSHDNKTMYYIDSPTYKIAAYSYNPDTGGIVFQNIAMDLNGYHGMPDGMCIDEEDMLWVGFWGGGVIRRIDPLKHYILEEIPLPALNITSLAFGGPNMDELFIASGNRDTDINKYPSAGAVFRIKPGVKGPYAYRFKG